MAQHAYPNDVSKHLSCAAAAKAAATSLNFSFLLLCWPFTPSNMVVVTQSHLWMRCSRDVCSRSIRLQFWNIKCNSVLAVSNNIALSWPVPKVPIGADAVCRNVRGNRPGVRTFITIAMDLAAELTLGLYNNATLSFTKEELHTIWCCEDIIGYNQSDLVQPFHSTAVNSSTLHHCVFWAAILANGKTL